MWWVSLHIYTYRSILVGISMPHVYSYAPITILSVQIMGPIPVGARHRSSIHKLCPVNEMAPRVSRYIIVTRNAKVTLPSHSLTPPDFFYHFYSGQPQSQATRVGNRRTTQHETDRYAHYRKRQGVLSKVNMTTSYPTTPTCALLWRLIGFTRQIRQGHLQRQN